MRLPRVIARLLGKNAAVPDSLPVEGTAPEFTGVGPWINGGPLTVAALRGKVVLVDFWTHSCVNCIRTLPHLNAWHEKYADKGLVIVGVHTPEFDFEKDETNVRSAVTRNGIRYPVVMDDDYALWDAYKNHYWPAQYFIDRDGRIRFHHFGEGGYADSEAVIRTLLEETGASLDEGTDATDEERDDGRTPETYLGHRRLEYLGSPERVVMDRASRYSTVSEPARNVFYFDGEWTLRPEFAEASAGAKIVFRYDAAKVNLVLDGGGRVKIEIDGGPVPDAHAGADAENGGVTVTEGRLYELIDSEGGRAEHVLTLTFEDAGTRAYAFTFG